jgi:energy-coupling factor transporter ATP-binding protein EcfA2
MKIQSIEIKNYKAFYGEHSLKLNGKNVFIYGENGSGKSSLYYAFKDFFQSSIEDIDMEAVDNIFLEEGEKGDNFIKVKFKPDKDGNRRGKTYKLAATDKDTNNPSDTSIRDANTLKSFLTYKHLLDIHHIKKDGEINLFDLLVKGVLKHFKYTLTNGKELGEMWKKIEELVEKDTGQQYRIDQKRREVDAALEEFNKAFTQLFKPPTPDEPNPEYILDHANPILEQFEQGLDVSLRYMEATPESSYKSLKRDEVRVQLKYAGKDIPKPHLFLNEARLSALAISIYLGMIKRHPQLRPYKVLFLDDVFIGLDISNRLPLLKILKNDFQEYQIFITTYDKPWFEYANSFIDKSEWTVKELRVQKFADGYEIPIVIDQADMILKSRDHFNIGDYKSASVYARSEFERIIMKYCEDRSKEVRFKRNIKKYSSQDFWQKTKDDVSNSIGTRIESSRNLILNDLSHYNPTSSPFRSEVSDAIDAVEDLRTELRNLP